MAKPSKKTAQLILVSVCVATATLLSVSEPGSWPFWCQVVFVGAIFVTFSLLSALGVWEALGLKGMPGSGFNSRYVFGGLGLLAGTAIWIWALARVVPKSLIGELVLVAPPGLALLLGVLFLTRGSMWR